MAADLSEPSPLAEAAPLDGVDGGSRLAALLLGAVWEEAELGATASDARGGSCGGCTRREEVGGSGGLEGSAALPTAATG